VRLLLSETDVPAVGKLRPWEISLNLLGNYDFAGHDFPEN